MIRMKCETQSKYKLGVHMKYQALQVTNKPQAHHKYSWIERTEQ